MDMPPILAPESLEQRSMGAKWNRLLLDSRQRAEPERSPFPTDAQVDFLKAALLPVEQAAPAWQRWRARGLTLQNVHPASIRLFPLLWMNSDAAGVSAADRRILKGVWRQTFADSAVKLRAAVNTTRMLTDAGIPVLFFKGAAVIAMNDRSPGQRILGDVDILVPEADAETAIGLLVASGYRPKFSPVRLGLSHGWACLDRNGCELDVHWWAFKEAGDDSAMFTTARQGTLLGQPVLIPSATECLIAAVAHAFPAEGSPMQWIADAMLIFRLDGADIDWAALLDRAQRPGLTLPLADGLGFLQREFQAPVPASVIDELRRRPVAWRERAAHWVWLKRPPVGLGMAVTLERDRARRRHYKSAQPRDFLWYLAESTGVRRRDVIKRAPRRALRAAALLALRYGTPGRRRSNAPAHP